MCPSVYDLNIIIMGLDLREFGCPWMVVYNMSQQVRQS